MPQHKHSSIKIIDNLAEITSHHDRQVLEKSLLKTLNELFPGDGMRLFRVREFFDQHEISLLAFCVNDVIVSSIDNPRVIPSAADLSAGLTAAIENEDVEVIDNKVDGGWHVIYPAFDSHGDIFAVLVHSCKETVTPNDQRLIYGILKVYSNYLALIDKSQRDKLTGLYNRETLDNEITKILVKTSDQLAVVAVDANSQRRREVVSRYWLGVIDIDHFKQINDNYGHLYGDEVIILVARMMTSGFIRDDDLVYRYGGEEFVVLLKAPDEKDAMLTFERLRSRIAEHRFPQLDHVTVSIGFVEVARQQSPSDVIGQADEALYFAKEHGRNQVQSYSRLVEENKIKVPQPIMQSDVELF